MLIEIIRWDTYSRDVSYTDKNNEPLNITWSTVYLTVKRKQDMTSNDTVALIQKVITTHTEPTQWKTKIELSKEDTAVTVWDHLYDIQLVIWDQVRSTHSNRFVVLQDTTTTS
jgi:hypothetical protein